MPAYAKFLKEILSNKRKLEDELITIPYQVSALVQRIMPNTQKDPGSFTLPVKIGDLELKGSLADLGASVKFMPISIAKHHKFHLHPMRKTIQSADRTMRVPYGELEDIPIHVVHVFMPCDFVVMDMEEDLETPLILGSEALKTLGVVINCKNDSITVEVANERLVFEFSKTLKTHMMDRICRVCLVEDEIEEATSVVHTGDELYASLTDAPSWDMEAVKEFSMLLETAIKETQDEAFEILATSNDKQDCSMPPPKVEFKPLPFSVKYVF
ncbi:uncharacterized protein LOC104898996 [Beta vulgaris subsp. vulgaris]|uniref:uncharacterized protein LOC104898996 n=1 Tax=Beta vulgaris subsp. vulgaris TaxID=3555 RepID=UPI00053F58BC|nr:uncharacterized protein LOC104898996 [Beta vulgaris subsp. vulgaris]